MPERGVQRTDEVAILKVKAIQLIARRFGVHSVLIDDESCAFGVVCNALTDLPGGVSA